MKNVAKASGKLRYHIVIVELDSNLPRRDSKKPNLYIGKSLSSTEVRLGELQRGAGPEFAKGHYVSVFAKAPYSKPTKDPKVANRRLDETIEKYARLGHMVNNNKSEWHVYVIDLKQDHLNTKPKSGHVYVGSTSKTVSERVKEHQKGAKASKGHRLNSKYVTEYFDSLNKYLSPNEKFYTSKSAEEKEERLAEELCRKGYLVRAGQFTPNPNTCISKRKTKNQ
jgi:predicted GIY-YIG superfamily endonuclease